MMSLRKKRDKEFHLNLLDVLLLFAGVSVVSLLISVKVFWFVGGLTAILFCIWLVIIWDDIIIWWSTRKR